MYNDDYVFDLVDSITASYPGDKHAKLKRFDGFFPLSEVQLIDENNECFFMEATLDCLEKPINTAVLHTGNYDGAVFMHIRKADIRELRGIKKKIFSPNPYKLSTWMYTHAGRLDFVEENYVAIDSAKHNCIQYIGNRRSDVVMFPHRIEEIKRCAQLLISTQFMLENMPTVYIKEPDAKIGCTFPLEDASMLKALFKLRDIEQGKERRSALRHIVRSHERTYNKNTADELKVFVKKHLRGQTVFNWLGMECRINLPI